MLNLYTIVKKIFHDEKNPNLVCFFSNIQVLFLCKLHPIAIKMRYKIETYQLQERKLQSNIFGTFFQTTFKTHFFFLKT